MVRSSDLLLDKPDMQGGYKVYTVAMLRTYCSSNSLSTFLSRFPRPILLIEKRGHSPSTSQSERYAARTQMAGVQAFFSFTGKKMGEPVQEPSLIFDFQETENEQRITIGRLSCAHIQLKDTCVSKFHAYFQEERRRWRWFATAGDGTWYITDVGSVSGTFWNGKLLQPHESQRIKSRDGVVLADIYCCTFFSAKDFYLYIGSF